MTEECLGRIPMYSVSKEDLYLGRATGLKRQAMAYELIEQGVISITEPRCKSQNVVRQASKTLPING